MPRSTAFEQEVATHSVSGQQHYSHEAFDWVAPGNKMRVLTVVDIFSKFSPAIDPRPSYWGEDVVATLERVCAQTGYPSTICIDQGS